MVNVTRQQFHQLDKKKRDQLKRVAYVTPCTFNTPTARRVYENAEAFYLVAIDIDDSSEARPFVADPQMLVRQLEPLPFAAYTTGSSTPEQPRLRIFIQCAGLDKDLYAKAVQTCAQHLGLKTVTKESLVLVQPMYLPTMFSGDTDDDHPLIATSYGPDATPLTESDIVDVNVPRNSATAPKQPTSFSALGDDLDYLRPSVDGIDLDDVREALTHLDPDVTYPEWLEVAAALKHQFYDKDQEGYELFDEWSAKGAKYVDSDDTLAKWKSLRPTPKGRAPVTIRTVLHRAQEAGWTTDKLSTKCYANTVKWICDPTRTGSELMAEGIKRIAATPLVSNLERGTLLSALRDAMRQKDLKINPSDLKKELYKYERKESQIVTPKVTPDAQLPAWARGICYVAKANEFFHRAADRSMDPVRFDHCFNVHLTEPDSANGKPIMLARDYALNMAKIPRVDDYRYDPAHSEQAFIVDGKKRFINTYLPTFPEPNPATAEQAGDLFLGHICRLVQEEAYQVMLIDWLAFQVQNPGIKIRYAVLIQGAEGCGKTLLAEAMLAVLGKGNVNRIDANTLLKDLFNGWAMGSQLVAVEEIRVIGHNRYEVMNRLKPCISNDFISVRQPYREAVQMPNNVNYIMFTNHHDSLAVSESDRRYLVINSPLQNKQQVAQLGPKHFDPIYQMLKTNAGGLRAWFESWSISPEFKADGHAPTTTYLSDLMRASASPITAAVSDAITDQDHALLKVDLVSTKALRAVLEVQNLPRFTDQTLAGVLRELDYVCLGRFRVDDDRHYLWAKRGTYFDKVGGDCATEARVRLKGKPVDANGQTLLFNSLL